MGLQLRNLGRLSAGRRKRLRRGADDLQKVLLYESFRPFRHLSI